MYKLSIKERFRTWLVFKLDLIAKACWFELYGWAISGEPFSELWRILKSHPQRCIDDAASVAQGCYCNKYHNEHKPYWSGVVLRRIEEENALQS